MDITLIKTLNSLAFVIIISCVFKVFDWMWLKPKRLERYLRKQGFRGHPYKLFLGNKKDIGLMVRQSHSKPMDGFSNDYYERILPFYYHTISNYGENSYYWNGPIPTIIVTEPEKIREIMMRIYEFQKPLLHPILKKLSNGLIRLEGHQWAYNRKLINPAFHMEKLKHMISAFQVSCEDMMQEWNNRITSKDGSFEIDIWSSLHNMSADAISRAAFGSSFEEGRRIFELLRQHLELVIYALQSIYIPGWRFVPTKRNNKAARINNEIESLVKGMVYKRQEAIEAGDAPKDDLLGILLKSYYDGVQFESRDRTKKQTNVKLSLKQVIEECKLFYVAGQETTSALLVWTLILLGKNRGWQKQAREEVIDKFGHGPPNFIGLNELKKVNMIFHEVLRLYPPINTLTRQVTHDTKLGDVILPSGVHIHLAMVHVQHNEKLWGVDAKEFNPLRFSEGVLKATQGNMSFFSFGWGPRICIGSNFAMAEAKLTLSMILQRFSFELSSSYVHAPTIGFGTLRPQFGANLVFHRI